MGDLVAEMAQGSAVANALGLTGGAATILAVAWWLLRIVLRRERVADASAGGTVHSIDQSQKLTESLRGVINDLRAYITDLQKRLDEAYSERNLAVSMDGAKQARIEMLQLQLDAANARIRELEALEREMNDGIEKQGA